MADKEFKKVIDLFDAFGTKLKLDTIASINKYGHSASGQSALAGSLRFTIRESANGLTFFFYMSDYGDFIDSGTKVSKNRGTGGDKMVNSLENWIQQRPSLTTVARSWQSTYKEKGIVKQRKTKISFDKARKSLAFVIKRNIHKRGIIKRFGYKGSKFFTNVINDGRVQKLEKELANELGKEIKIVFTNGILKGKI